MAFEYYGYPANYLNYMENIRKVTKEEVQRVASPSLNNEKFITLVLGIEKDLGKPLSTPGEVTNVDVTIPADR